MKITLKPAETSDADFARDVHHRAYHDVVVEQYGSWNELAQDGYFQSAWGSTPHQIILCDGISCGYTCVENRSDDIHVRELVIHPDFQNRGIGSSVLRQVMAYATKRQVPIRLGTCHKNRAFYLYQNLGFEEFDKTDTHILLEWVPPQTSDGKNSSGG